MQRISAFRCAQNNEVPCRHFGISLPIGGCLCYSLFQIYTPPPFCAVWMLMTDDLLRTHSPQQRLQSRPSRFLWWERLNGSKAVHTNRLCLTSWACILRGICKAAFPQACPVSSSVINVYQHSDAALTPTFTLSKRTCSLTTCHFV